ncbi:MAG: CaiB/BaiF CoA transferase family protein [Gammaproteobacteria bacterium]
MPGPLHGIRIIDLSAMISGPMATMILGDQGADVLKIENPDGGDYVRKGANRQGGLAASFLNNNRNKKSVAINLKNEQGKEVLRQLIKGADVFIQNFRPGVIDRMGFDEDAVRAIEPNIIYASIAGFGFEGPFANRPVYDPLIQAMSGLTTVQAGSDEERPRLVRTIVPDKTTAITAAQAITAALLARERTGKGQHIKLSMLASVVSFLWGSDMGSQTFAGRELPQQAAASFRDLVYETKSGHISVAVMSDKEWHNLIKALDKPQWLADERFKTPALRDKNINERLAVIQDALLEKTADDWIDLLEQHGVPCAKVLTRNEMIIHPQVEANNIITEYEHPAAGRLRQSNPAADFSLTPSSIRSGAPLLGEHTIEEVAKLNYSKSDIDKMIANGILGAADKSA